MVHNKVVELIDADATLTKPIAYHHARNFYLTMVDLPLRSGVASRGQICCTASAFLVFESGVDVNGFMFTENSVGINE